MTGQEAKKQLIELIQKLEREYDKISDSDILEDDWLITKVEEWK